MVDETDVAVVVHYSQSEAVGKGFEQTQIAQQVIGAPSRKTEQDGFSNAQGDGVVEDFLAICTHIALGVNEDKTVGGKGSLTLAANRVEVADDVIGREPVRRGGISSTIGAQNQLGFPSAGGK